MSGKVVIGLILYLVCVGSVHASEAMPGSLPALEAGFKTPSKDAYPKTWMHSMSGNMSKQGFTEDLEAISRAGMGGVLLFNVSHTIPRGKVRFNSPEYHDIIIHAAKTSEELGLSFGLHNCDGWTSTGGPWVTLDNSMKMVAWSESIVSGGKNVSIQLPKPTSRRGYYEDVAVVAYPSLPSELIDAGLDISVTSSDPTFDTHIVSDGRWDKTSTLHVDADGKAWMQVAFDKPRPVQSVFMSLHKAIVGSRQYRVSASMDGVSFAPVGEYTLKRLGKKEFAMDERIPRTLAKYFRLEIEDNYQVSEVKLSVRPNFSDYLAKTSLFKKDDSELIPTSSADQKYAIDKIAIKDLTGRVNTDGVLDAHLPNGNWTVLRFGFTTTGAVNTPSSKEGKGLEVDKMRKQAYQQHYDAFLKKIIKNVKAVAPNAFQYLEIDSFEVGSQNWTQGYLKYFEQAYGYSLLPYLPVYAGRVVDSTKTTDRVLADIRKLNSDLIVENYFSYFSELTRKNGLVSYVEPYTFNAPFNELDASKNVDIPMGEFWLHQRYKTEAAVSGGRIYGRNIISAESFSARPDINWQSHPRQLKSTGDTAWAYGINEFMFHRYAHQANTHVKPGMTMSQWGSHIDRTQTWWDSAAAPWFTYLARGSYLLRQGNPVSDILLYLGEEAPITPTNDRKQIKPAIPPESNFDSVNADVLLNRLSVENGRLVLPEGVRYKMLVLKGEKSMSLPVLERLNAFSEQGVLILGKRPQALAKHNPSKKEQKKFQHLIKTVWSKPNTYAKWDWASIYKKYVFSYDLQMQGNPDLLYEHRKTGGADIYFMINKSERTHRGNIIFDIQGKKPEVWDAETGEVTELNYFKAVNGKTTMMVELKPQESKFIVFKDSIHSTYVSNWTVSNGGAPVAVDAFSSRVEIDERGILIESLLQGTHSITLNTGKRFSVKSKALSSPIAIDGHWQVAFEEASGFGETLSTAELFDWSNSSVFDLKHYSGTARYETVFELSPKSLAENNKMFLDLGEVHMDAKIVLNGREVGTLWQKPYRKEVHEYLRPGKNTLIIYVTNLWSNRLIGDEYYPRTDGYKLGSEERLTDMPKWYTDNLPPPESQRLTFTTMDFYDQDSPLLSSGLLGPVKITPLRQVIIPLN